MKRTANMVYFESYDSDELVLFCENDVQIYKCVLDVIQSLKKKVIRGEYDSNKAVDAYYRVATVGAKKYAAEFGSRNFTFPVQVRFTAAVRMESDFRHMLYE